MAMHERDGGGKISKHELSAHAHDAEARAMQPQITAAIRPRPARVNGAIHFNDWFDGWRTEVGDETGEPALG